jgi:hypothetical protein
MKGMHPWQEKGLGAAPFKFENLERRPKGDNRCAYCNHRIEWLFWIHASDGSRFVVGSECIKKVEPINSPLRIQAESEIKSAKEAEKSAKEKDDRRRVASALKYLESHPDLLKNRPHPYRVRGTCREWANYVLANGGLRKQLQVTLLIEAAIERASPGTSN